MMFWRLGSSGESAGPKIATKVTTKRMASASSGHLAATMLRPARREFAPPAGRGLG
jgi:hypothetical protein